MQPNQSTDEFHFINHTNNVNEYQTIQKIVPIYNEYDNLMHQPTYPKNLNHTNQRPLKETTNTKKLMRVFAQKVYFFCNFKPNIVKDSFYFKLLFISHPIKT